MRIFVGNLSFQTSEEALHTLFSAEGEVASAQIITDRDSQRSRGFGFVDMPNDAEAKNAILALNGKEVEGRPLTVNEAEERRQRSDDQGGGRRPPRY